MPTAARSAPIHSETARPDRGLDPIGPRAPTGVTGRGSLPRTGVVLISSPRVTPWLSALVAAIDGVRPVIAGAISIDPAEPADPPGPAILGSIADLPALVARFGLKAAVVCGSAVETDRVRRAAAGTGLDLRVVPAPEQLLAAIDTRDPRIEPCAAPFAAPASIDLGTLIGRTPHALDREAVARVLTRKRILITGAGGSIGAELARVAAGFAPERLILMERAENALFEIDRQMGERHPSLARRAVLHDVTDAEGTRRLLAELRPHVVFHAAAHKHVPLMEDHPGHAVINNLFGTKSIADAAVACGAERFVMISSDKAVNPTSVMGATKRLAELYVRGLGRGGRHATRLSMVRFGNVLGSACSVLTIWSTQIAEGGPVTITDPRMTRYFMTIPEAATLVVQSTTAEDADAADAVGVFVLDMGEPIRIVDLACRFVRAHGLWPRGENLPAPPPGEPSIDLVFTGARPGEKLHEELAYAAELLRPTRHPGVRRWGGPGFGATEVCRVGDMVAELGALRFSREPAEIVAAIRRHVPEFRPRPM